MSFEPLGESHEPEVPAGVVRDDEPVANFGPGERQSLVRLVMMLRSPPVPQPAIALAMSIRGARPWPPGTGPSGVRTRMIGRAGSLVRAGLAGSD